MVKFKTLVLFLVLALVLSACGPRMEPAPKVLEGRIFGTFFQVSIGTQHDFDEAEIKAGVLSVLEEVDRQMSTYRADSVLNQVNRAPLGEPIEIPEALFYVLKRGYAMSELSGGAFDFTVGGLVNLWGFGPEGRVTTAPDEAVLQERLRNVGYRFIQLDSTARTVTRHADVFVDLSGIAKGYAVDAVSEYLLSVGLNNHLVNIGGDLIARGKRNPHRQWHVGIEAPNDTQQIVRHILPLQEIAMVGSGDYRNYFEEAGVRYSHTIDPTTGRPISHRLAGVNVLGANTTDIDALATVLMVLGEEQGLAFANEHDIAALFLFRADDTFQTLASDRFERDYRADMVVPEVR